MLVIVCLFQECAVFYRYLKSEVHQGSVLGSLLFHIYINHCQCQYMTKIFTDNLEVISESGAHCFCFSCSVADICSCQCDIDTIHPSWSLYSNMTKYISLKFTRNSIPWQAVGSFSSNFPEGHHIRIVSSYRHLGVLVDVSLYFYFHIGSVVSKAAGQPANVLKRNVCMAKDFMLTLFVSHVRVCVTNVHGILVILMM